MERELFNSEIEILKMPAEHGQRISGSDVWTLGNKYVATKPLQKSEYLWPDGKWYEIAYPNYEMRYKFKQSFPSGFPNGAYFDTRDEVVALLEKTGHKSGF